MPASMVWLRISSEQWASRYPEWVSADEEVVDHEAFEAPASASGFVTIAAPLAGDAVGESTSPIAVHLNSGHRLEVRPGFCSDTLQRVVAALSP